MKTARFSFFTAGVALAMAALTPAPASAHPGHSLGDANAQHLLTSPDHLAVLALGGLGLWFAARLVQRRVPRQLLQGFGLLALLAAVVLRGIRS
jgi:uncharacterized membrane protein YfcA